MGLANAGAPGRGAPSGTHVLVVEDNVPSFVLIARLLAQMGIEQCEWKTSAWQVVQFADTLPSIDLILMEIHMPFLAGFQALQKIRATPRLEQTRVVALAADASSDDIAAARDAGFDSLLPKPLDTTRFPDQVQHILAGEDIWPER